MIAICLCSRGLVHSRTMEAIERARQLYTVHHTQVFFTHDLPIPAAQNDIAERALACDADQLWFVEEDMNFDEMMLVHLWREMKSSAADVVVTDYTIRAEDNIRAVQRTDNGEIMFSGMGSMLVDRSVFARIEKPWFDTGAYFWDPRTGLIEPRADRKSYGGQDVHFFAQCAKAGIRVSECRKARAGHLRMKNGALHNRTNQGVHEVIEI